GEPKNVDVAKRAIGARKSQRCEVKRGPFCIWPRHARHSTIENLADDRPANFGNKGNFALADSLGCVRGWRLQRFSWRRGWLHPDAVDGVRAWSSYASCSRHRFVRDHHLGQLRNV